MSDEERRFLAEKNASDREVVDSFERAKMKRRWQERGKRTGRIFAKEEEMSEGEAGGDFEEPREEILEGAATEEDTTREDEAETTEETLGEMAEEAVEGEASAEEVAEGAEREKLEEMTTAELVAQARAIREALRQRYEELKAKREELAAGAEERQKKLEGMRKNRDEIYRQIGEEPPVEGGFERNGVWHSEKRGATLAEKAKYSESAKREYEEARRELEYVEGEMKGFEETEAEYQRTLEEIALIETEIGIAPAEKAESSAESGVSEAENRVEEKTEEKSEEKTEPEGAEDVESSRETESSEDSESVEEKAGGNVEKEKKKVNLGEMGRDEAIARLLADENIPRGAWDEYGKRLPIEVVEAAGYEVTIKAENFGWINELFGLTGIKGAQEQFDKAERGEEEIVREEAIENNIDEGKVGEPVETDEIVSEEETGIKIDEVEPAEEEKSGDNDEGTEKEERGSETGNKEGAGKIELNEDFRKLYEDVYREKIAKIDEKEQAIRGKMAEVLGKMGVALEGRGMEIRKKDGVTTASEILRVWQMSLEGRIKALNGGGGMEGAAEEAVAIEEEFRQLRNIRKGEESLQTLQRLRAEAQNELEKLRNGGNR